MAENQKGTVTLDLMSISHFLLWFIIGLLFPNHYVLALILGIIWELLEVIFVEQKHIYNFLKKYWLLPERYWNEKKTNKGMDLILNMSGYFVGSSIASIN